MRRLPGGSDTREVLGFVRTAAARPFRDLPNWTERPRALDDAARAVRRKDAGRRRAGQDPLLAGSHLVKGVGAWPAGTMVHTGNHVQLDRRTNRLLANAAHHLVEVGDGVERRHLGVRPTVVQKQLASAFEEWLQVGA